MLPWLGVGLLSAHGCLLTRVSLSLRLRGLLGPVTGVKEEEEEEGLPQRYTSSSLGRLPDEFQRESGAMVLGRAFWDGFRMYNRTW